MALQYGTSSSIGLGTAVNSLASSLTAVAQTDVITPSTAANITDIIVRFTIAVGTITPSASTVINFYAFGSEDGTTYPGGSSTAEVLGSSAGAVTLASVGNNLKWIGSIICHTSGISFKTQPMNLAAAFGGTLPRKIGFVVQNQTGAALSSTGHSASYTEVYYN